MCLSSRTIEELQPPCEAYGGTCDQPATWIVRWHCTGCGHAEINLICLAHLRSAIQQFVHPLAYHKDGCSVGKRSPVLLDSSLPLR